MIEYLPHAALLLVCIMGWFACRQKVALHCDECRCDLDPMTARRFDNVIACEECFLELCRREVRVQDADRQQIRPIGLMRLELVCKARTPHGDDAA